LALLKSCARGGFDARFRDVGINEICDPCELAVLSVRRLGVLTVDSAELDECSSDNAESLR
jgi:hypothetical protein